MTGFMQLGQPELAINIPEFHISYNDGDKI